MRAHLARAKGATMSAVLVAGVATVVVVAIRGYGGAGGQTGWGGPIEGVLRVLGSQLVLGALLVVATLALLAAALAKVVRLVTTHVERDTGRILTAVAAAGVMFALLLPLLAVFNPLASATILAIVFLGPLGLLFAMGGLLALVELGVLPDRAGGPAVAAAGLLAATIGAGMEGLPAPLVFATAAGALVVWDVSTFGLGLTAELGHLPETRRVELFHGVLAVGVGAIAAAGLWAVVVGRRLLAIDPNTPIAAAIVVVGVFLLAAAIRG